MHNRLFFLFLCGSFLASCSPKLTSPLNKERVLLGEEAEVTVLPPGTQSPELAVVQESSQLKGEDAPNFNGQAKTLRIAFQGGLAYQLEGMASDMGFVVQQHLENMRQGWTYGADVTYFFSERLGLAFQFHNLYVADKMPASVRENEHVTRGFLEDYGNIWFLGPVFTYRLLSKDRKNAFFARAGVGAIGHYNYGKRVKYDDSYFFRGVSVGSLYEVGYDFGIANHLSVGASLLLFSGSISEYDQITGVGYANLAGNENNQGNRLTHIGLSLGLRYNL